MKLDLFLKGRLRHALQADELAALERVVREVREVDARHTLVHRGDRVEQSYYLMSGYMLRYIDDDEGDRQLVGIQVPGDFVDLHGFAMKRLDHDVASLSQATLAVFPHAAISDVIDRFTHLGRILWFSTLLDAAIHREWIFRMGRLSAEGRIAHVICELAERLKFVGLFDGRNFPIPLLQADFASAAGITKVHTNRVFASLRKRGLISSRANGQGIAIENEKNLCALAHFSPDYLYGEGELSLTDVDDR